MPRLTARSLAEMLHLPAYQQARILHDQKYPRQEPQVFRTPYYQPALAAIKKFYASGNDARCLTLARNDVQNIRVDSRRANLLRVIDAFENSTQFKRSLKPVPNSRVAAQLGAVDIRLSPDLRAVEGVEHAILYYNCRQVAVDAEVARLTAEIAHWICEQNGAEISMRRIEVVDLKQGRVLRFNSRRPSTLKLLKNNVRIIEALWDSV